MVDVVVNMIIVLTLLFILCPMPGTLIPFLFISSTNSSGSKPAVNNKRLENFGTTLNFWYMKQDMQHFLIAGITDSKVGTSVTL